MFKAAAIQMVSTDRLEENLAQAEAMIKEAVNKQVLLVVLPENFPLMSKKDTDRLALAEDYGAGPIQSFLGEQAKKHSIWLLGGTIPLAANGTDKAFAASLLYGPSGSCVARYNKIHLFDVTVDENNQEYYQESAVFDPGDKVVVAATDVGNIGLSVCYDLRFPELYRNMHKDHVQIIVAPSAFTATTGEAHWESLIRSRAIENLCYVIASNQGGLHVNGRGTWGHSMIVDHWGRVLACVEIGPGIAIANIDLHQQDKLRKTFPSLQHKKLKL